jgi:hypothetical protein
MKFAGRIARITAAVTAIDNCGRKTALLLYTLVLLTGAYGQITPSGDAYTNTAAPTANFGANALLNVESASQTAYIQFNLSSIPSGYTGADISQATLKLYVNAVTTAGSFNVDYVNGTWAENKITADLAPALGSTIAASVPLTTAGKNQYILINVTSAVQAWLNGTEPNDGIALVGNSPLNASFDSKENTGTSHPAELDIVFVNSGAQGPAGPQGSQGPEGLQGPSGPIGLTGLTGPPGPAGINNRGAWASSATYDVNDSVSYGGSSWIALTANTNSIPSATNSNWQLLAAPGINNQGSWVPTTNYQIGNAVTDGGQFWLTVFPNQDSEPSTLNPNWQLIAANGATGPAGPTGPQGAVGATGLQGPMGLTGATGAAGATGPQGPMGATGPQGPMGATGPQGPQGPAGPAGGISAGAMNAALLRWYTQTYSVGSEPFGVAFDGSNIWVANGGSNSVTKILASTGAVVGNYPVGAGPIEAAFDGTNIWVTNLSGNTVTKLLASSGAVVGSYPVGIQPCGVAFDGTNIWVANYGSNTVTELLASNGSLLKTYSVGSNPCTEAFDGANIWVANQGASTVTVLSASSGTVVGTYSVGPYPVGLAFDGTNIWTANSGTTTVTKLLGSSGAVVGTYSIGGIPGGVAFDGTNIWVTNTGANVVTKLSASSGGILASYPVGNYPNGLAFDGANIWVANQEDNTVTDIPIH